jgi:thimet oligopeptidase
MLRMHPGRLVAIVLSVLVALAHPQACQAQSAPAPRAPLSGSALLHAWELGDDPAELDRWVHEHLRRAAAAIGRLLAVKGARTLGNTLRTYDEAFNELIFAAQGPQVLYAAGATKELRDKAEALTQLANAAQTALSLNPDVYHALASLSSPADPAARHYLEHTLLEYHLAGADRDAATRDRIKALQDKITELGLTFERTVHDDVHSIEVDRRQLDALPPDFLAAHPPDARGQVKITTDPPDAYPVLQFASDADVRHRLFLACTSVGYPANGDILRKLLATRAQLAHLLGYPTWADLAMADLMMRSPVRLREFLHEIDAASREPGAREDAALLSFARQREPGLTQISAADRRYWQEQYRRVTFSFDSQSVRPYFPYAAVERGVIATAARLLRVQIRPVSGVRTWHPSVTTYDVYDGALQLGRIYLDMHPREGKDKWFSTQLLTAGIGHRQLPEATLVGNFPGGRAGDPGLMQYSEVVVFLHEFGHLMHHVMGGQSSFAGTGAFFVENDFVEAPAQMLEEFFHDYAVLKSFAHHYQTGAVLPEELYTRMTRADTYGRAALEQRQLMYAAAALDFHTLPAASIDFDAVWRRDYERYNNTAFVAGDHFWAAFTHLNGYSSNYYTYVLDKVIALDFFAQFDPRNLLGGAAGLRYRQQVLAPGATRPAAELVRDFLGREPGLDAYRRWMLEEFATPAPSAATD